MELYSDDGRQNPPPSDMDRFRARPHASAPMVVGAVLVRVQRVRLQRETVSVPMQAFVLGGVPTQAVEALG